MINKLKLTALFIIAIFKFCSAQSIIKITDFGGAAGTSDCTQALYKALEASHKIAKPILVFPKGTYHFYSDFAIDKYLFICNNDEGLKRIVFPILNFPNLTIDGQGSLFIFHGFVNPFVVEHSRQITLKNFSVDLARSMHSEGVILANNADGMDIQIPTNFPYAIKNGTLQFLGQADNDNAPVTTVSKDVIYPYSNLLEFDAQKRKTAFMVKDYYLKDVPLIAEDLGDRKVYTFKGTERPTG